MLDEHLQVISENETHKRCINWFLILIALPFYLQAWRLCGQSQRSYPPTKRLADSPQWWAVTPSGSLQAQYLVLRHLGGNEEKYIIRKVNTYKKKKKKKRNTIPSSLISFTSRHFRSFPSSLFRICLFPNLTCVYSDLGGRVFEELIWESGLTAANNSAHTNLCTEHNGKKAINTPNT